MREGRRWRRLVEAHVDFLDDRGYRIAAVAAETYLWVAVTYANVGSAIRFSRDHQAHGCEVDLGRLVDGQVPPHPIWMSAEPINWVPLTTVLEVRAPGLIRQARRLRGLGADEISSQLTFWAQAIHTAVPDFLDGSLACIDEAAALLRRRWESEPETLTVSLPEHASADEMRRTLQEAQATVPPEVKVVGQHYQDREPRKPRGRNGT